mgnify:CR=1 FL=1
MSRVVHVGAGQLGPVRQLQVLDHKLDVADRALSQLDLAPLAALLPQVASGELLLALALEESHRHSPYGVAATAAESGGNWQVSGEKVFVLDGHVADKLIVVARTSGSAGDRDGITLLLVDAGRARSLGMRPLARIVSTAVAGVHPSVMGMGPVAETTPYAFEPRALWGGVHTVERREMLASLGAPCVIILAAGEGTRLRPYTQDRQKCLVEVAGRPLLLRQVDALLEAGMRNLAGLDLSAAEPGEYELIALPLRLVGVDSSPVRAVLRTLD